MKAIRWRKYAAALVGGGLLLQLGGCNYSTFQTITSLVGLIAQLVQAGQAPTTA